MAMTTWRKRMYRAVMVGTVLGAALGWTVLTAPPACAAPGEMAMIETRAPLTDQSDSGINAALKNALERAIRGAAAMGLGQVQVSGAYRGNGFVAVQVLATTPDEAASGGPAEPDLFSSK
jgi:hypothetical protein